MDKVTHTLRGGGRVIKIINYCVLEKLSQYFENGHFCENLKKNGKFTNVQVHVTFFHLCYEKNVNMSQMQNFMKFSKMIIT